MVIRTLDVVAKNLAMTLGTTLSEALNNEPELACCLSLDFGVYLATFAASRHVIKVLGGVVVCRGVAETRELLLVL